MLKAMAWVRCAIVVAALLGMAGIAEGQALSLGVEPITAGPKNHFFGYIGHCLTIPWNASGRYIVALRTDFHDHLPKPGEMADVVLIDRQQGNKVTAVDQTRAWNLQQGTMLFWNPDRAETQFFFNDVDPQTGVVFTALYDIEERRRVREYRFGEESIANGGVAPNGRYFAGINYGKISRSRDVISYAGTFDFSASGPANPENDGLFRVEISSGERKLLVSYKQLSDLLLDNEKNRAKLGPPEKYPVYVHHTMWNRESEWIAFIVRGKQNKRPSAGCAVRVDGSDLRQIPFAGHPEWLEGGVFAMASKEHGSFNLYDVAQQKWTGQIGGGAFRDTDDDNALSPDGKWLVGSYKDKTKPSEYVYTFFRRADGAVVHSPVVPTKVGGGDLRLDPAPRWNRTSDQVLVPGMAKDGTVQLYILTLKGLR
jgi:hypothetical protein